MLAFPVRPQLVRIFRKLMVSELNQSSSLATQPMEAEGKKPKRLFSPNREDPSTRAVAWKKYLSNRL